MPHDTFVANYSSDLNVRIRQIESFLSQLPPLPSSISGAIATGDFSEVVVAASPAPVGGNLIGDVMGPVGANQIESLQGDPFNLSAQAEGDFLIFNSLGEWGNRNWTPTEFGIGAAPTQGRFEVTDDDVSTYFTTDSIGSSGLRGWRIDKLLATEATPHGWTWLVEGVRLVDIGMDFDTAANGRSDFVLLGDHTFGASDDTFGDVFRYSLAADAATHGTNTGKFEIGAPAGSPAAKSDFITVNGGDDTSGLGGLRINYWSSNTTYNALSLLNRHGTSRRAGINFEDLWRLETDADADGGQEIGFSASGTLRLQLDTDGKGGVSMGGNSPLANNTLWNLTRTAASAPTIRTYNKITSVADTNITASTEVNDVFWDLARTMTWATGNFADQRFVRIGQPTIAFNGASTVDRATTLYVAGAPVQGSNASLSARYGIWLDEGMIRLDGDGTQVAEIGLSNTTAEGAYYGRFPVLIPGVGVKFVSLHDA